MQSELEKLSQPREASFTVVSSYESGPRRIDYHQLLVVTIVVSHFSGFKILSYLALFGMQALTKKTSLDMYAETPKSKARRGEG